MLCNLPVAIRLASVSISLLAIVSCGSAKFGTKDKRSGASDQEQTAGAKDDGCLNLGGPDKGDEYPAQHPGQQPGQYPDNGYDKGGDDVVIVVPPNDGKKGEEPPPPPPGKGGKQQPPPQVGKPCQKPDQYPGQKPDCKSNCGKDDGYRPIDTDDDVVIVQPYPTQKPIGGDCGKSGKYCDDGGPGQWPTQTTNGGTYDHGRAKGCMEAFRNAGYDTRGQWNIDARVIKNVSVLSSGGVSDYGNEHTLVMIKNVSVLGTTHFELLNPNALYCIENVSVLDQTLVSSCHTGNVVFGSDVNVLSTVETRPVDCH